MRSKIFFSLLMAIVFLSEGCRTNQTNSPTEMTQTHNQKPQNDFPKPILIGGEEGNGHDGVAPMTPAMALAPIIIYKTRGDYRNLVPITLSADKKYVVARPAPSDLRRGDGFCTPVELADGYLLDRRGIGPTTAFVEYTYEQYFAIKGIPSQSDLLQRIVDADPFTELYRCDRSRCNPNDIKSMNAYIKAGKPGAVSLK